MVEDSLVNQLTTTGRLELHYKEHRRPKDINFRKMVLSYQLVFDTRDSLVSRTDYYWETLTNPEGDIYEHKSVVSKWEYYRDSPGQREHVEFYKYHVYYHSRCTQSLAVPPAEVYYYDSSGRLIRKVTSTSGQQWKYNAMGQLTEIQNSDLGGIYGSTRYYYDLNGRLIEKRHISIREMQVDMTIFEYY